MIWEYVDTILGGLALAILYLHIRYHDRWGRDKWGRRNGNGKSRNGSLYTSAQEVIMSPARRRRIRDGEEYTIDDNVELEERNPDPDPPPEEIRGEPWGWTKPGPRPRGFREDGDYSGDRERGNPGPFDGRWER